MKLVLICLAIGWVAGFVSKYGFDAFKKDAKAKVDQVKSDLQQTGKDLTK